MAIETDIARLAEQIERLTNSGQVLSAIPLANQMVANFPNHSRSHITLAKTLIEAGHLGKALESAEIACRLAPADFECLFLCGKLYNNFKLHEFALPLLTKSVEIEPRACLSQYELGMCYFEMKLAERALPHFRNALQLLPSDGIRDEIRILLAQCLQAANKFSEAVPILRRLSSESEKFRANALLLLVDFEKTKPKEQLALKVSALRDRSELSNMDRRILWLTTGKIYLNAGQHQNAFEAWQKASEFGKADGWATKNYGQEFLQTTAFYCRELFDACATWGHESSAPVFIAGMPRSGTTLTEQIIAAHSQAGGVGELDRWASLDQALRNDYRVADHAEAILKNAKNGELQARADETLKLFWNILTGVKERVVEKMPHNFIYAGYQALLFTNAKFIHIRRNPADTYISMVQQNFSAYHTYAYDQVEYVKEYAFHEKLMTYWKSLFGDRILTVQYEKLAIDPETEARRIIEFIGLPWEDQCLKFYERKSTVRTFSAQQVRQPIYSTSIERWRVYEPFLGSLFKAMDEMGLKYPPEN